MNFLLDYRYAYLVGNLILALPWFYFYFKRKDLRKEMVVLGLIVSVFAPITDHFLFYDDYWRPLYFYEFLTKRSVLGLESPLFGFLIAGISAVIYEFVYKKKALYSKPRNFQMIIIIALNILGTFALVWLGLNSIWANVAMLILCSIYMIYKDKDLLPDFYWSPILLISIILVLYSIWFMIYPEAYHRFWVTDNLSGILLGRIPLEEVVWFFTAGMFIGILYEFWRNVRKYKSFK